MKKVVLTTAFALAMILNPVTELKAQEFEFPGLSGFEIVREYPDYVPEDLWDYINGAADAYFTYLFMELFIAEYVKGDDIIKVEVYDHELPLMAYGIYSFERSPGYSFLNLGAQGYAEPGMANFLKDRYYVKISTNSSSQEIKDAVVPLARAVANALPGGETLPDIVQRLPEEGGTPNSDIYIFESVLGHSFLRGGLTAGYTIDGKSFTFCLFETGSDEKAVEVSTAYMKNAGLEEDMKRIVPDGDISISFNDRFNGYIHLLRRGSDIAIFQGLPEGELEFAKQFFNRTIK